MAEWSARVIAASLAMSDSSCRRWESVICPLALDKSSDALKMNQIALTLARLQSEFTIHLQIVAD
jgi:hypothetical protein